MVHDTGPSLWYLTCARIASRSAAATGRAVAAGGRGRNARVTAVDAQLPPVAPVCTRGERVGPVGWERVNHVAAGVPDATMAPFNLEAEAGQCSAI